jgi:hypothetical protein
MKRNIEIELPNHLGAYKEIKFIARASENYNLRQAADGLAELFECLYDQVPNKVMERLRVDPRTINLRKRLEGGL